MARRLFDTIVLIHARRLEPGGERKQGHSTGVAGADARELLWELGRQRISEGDLVLQPRHHCYVGASVRANNLPAFSMTVRKPDLGDPDRA